MDIPSSDADKALFSSLSSQQLHLLSIWLIGELINQIDEGYAHPDLVFSLTRMAQKIRLIAKNKDKR